MEENGNQTYADLESMAERVGLNPIYLVRHFAPADVSTSMVGKITPSVNLGKDANGKLIETCKLSDHGFMLETDYMDDPRRPGAVLGPKIVPKRTQQLAALAEEKEFLKNYTIPMVQLDPMQVILVFSHSHNTSVSYTHLTLPTIYSV